MKNWAHCLSKLRRVLFCEAGSSALLLRGLTLTHCTTAAPYSRALMPNIYYFGCTCLLCNLILRKILLGPLKKNHPVVEGLAA